MYTFEAPFNINDKAYAVFDNQIRKVIIKNVIFIDGGVEYKVEIDNKYLFEKVFVHVSSASVAKTIQELERRWNNEEEQKKINGVITNQNNTNNKKQLNLSSDFNE